MATPYQVIARKWRPQTFDDVVGQDHVVRTLKNAIARNRIAHAYLLVDHAARARPARPGFLLRRSMPLVVPTPVLIRLIPFVRISQKVVV